MLRSAPLWLRHNRRDQNGPVSMLIGYWPVLPKVKLSDRMKRLELIGKHIDVQAFKDKIEHTGAVALTISR
jgi:hypothetical protein